MKFTGISRIGLLVLMVAMLLAGCQGQPAPVQPTSPLPSPTPPPSLTAEQPQAQITVPTSTERKVLFEGWESAKLGKYRGDIMAHLENRMGTIFEADAGLWGPCDSFTLCTTRSDLEDPSWPKWSPHYAEIVESEGNKYLEMNVVDSNTTIVDDFWVLLGEGKSGERPYIPLNEMTTISFTANGKLNESSTGGSKGGNWGFIGIRVCSITYTIYELPPVPEKGWGPIVTLGRGGSHTRNLLDDYTKLAGKEYKGNEHIQTIELVVVGRGHATFNDIKIEWQ